MQVHICSPYSVGEKNLGRSYNEVMALLPDDWWACFTDTDVLFLTPDCGEILHGYAERYPDAGILTCYTNRLSPLSRKQLLGGTVSEVSDIKYHIHLAEQRKAMLWTVSPIFRDISGMLMMISKKTWTDHKFSEDGKCLGIDTMYGRKIREAGKTILRCNGLFVWHSYRIMKGIHSKEHLL